ncbi:Replication factor A protein 1 [Spiromyces aspiralis]|uniref:Replication factor A protein 1 n=1 Tax=Spiromyces aspiralis TaxID=68401 RepID=A0ACC1HSS8_9FUNG|nr:Replication factor A protein 1 [Spiromyces aspiralis]
MQGGAQGGDMQARQADPSKTVAQVRDEGLGEGDKPDYFSTKATIVYLKPDNLAYPACPNEGCNKKVIEENGQWRCEKCDTVFGEPSYRYIFTVAVGDHTGQMWVQCFNEIGEQIFGRPAREMVALQMADENQFQKVVRDSMFQTYNFRCRARAEVFNDVRRMRYTANRLSSIDYVKEAANLSGLIDAYSN